MQEEQKMFSDEPQVFVLVRTDLSMTRGKICAQAAHAVLGLYTELRDEVALAIWGSLDYSQVYLEAGSAEQLYQA